MSVKKQILMASLMLAVLSVSVAGVGIATPYWKENPLVMQPGELKDVSLNLQNMVGDEEITLRAVLAEGSEIATITDSSLDYVLPAKSADTNVHLRIEIPNDARVGDVYKLRFSFTTVTPGESGALTLGLSIDKSFDVIIGEVREPAERERPAFGSTGYTLAVILIAIAVLIWWWLSQGKKRRR